MHLPRPLLMLLGASLVATAAGACGGGGTTSSSAPTTADAATGGSGGPAGTMPGASTEADSAGSGSSGGAPGAKQPTTTGADAGDVTPGKPAPPGKPTTTKPASGGLVLEGNGLGVVHFGAAQASVIATLSGQLGSAQVAPTNAEVCGERTSATWATPGIVVYFTDGHFDGWEIRKAGVAKTAKGIRVGSTIAEVKSAYGAQFSWFTDSTLGDELTIKADASAPAISGLADGKTPTSHVQRLYAGAICAAR